MPAPTTSKTSDFNNNSNDQDKKNIQARSTFEELSYNAKYPKSSHPRFEPEVSKAKPKSSTKIFGRKSNIQPTDFEALNPLTVNSRQKKNKTQSLYQELYLLFTAPEQKYDYINWGDIWNLKKLNQFFDKTFGFVNALPAPPSMPAEKIEEKFNKLVEQIEQYTVFDPNYHFTINTSKKTNLLALSIKHPKIFEALLEKGANNTSPVITIVADKSLSPKEKIKNRLIQESDQDTILVGMIKNVYPLKLLEKVIKMPNTNINYQNERGDCVLHALCGISEDLREKLHKNMTEEYFSAVLSLLATNNADFTLRNKINNVSALELAIQNKNKQVALELVEKYGVLKEEVDQVYLKLFENRMGNIPGMGNLIKECVKTAKIQNEKKILEESVGFKEKISSGITLSRPHKI